MLISPNQGIKEGLRSGKMIVPGDQWPVFLYAGYEYDPKNPWKGLFRSTILVCVGSLEVFPAAVADFSGLKAYKHMSWGLIRGYCLARTRSCLVCG
jgi:hypothetical protein